MEMDWYCSNCFGEGSISHHQTEKPLCVVCGNCSNIDAYVWCEKCGMGGQISTTNFNDRPTQWVCSNCSRKYDLPSGFYEHYVTFTPVAFSEKIRYLLPITKRYSDISPRWLQRTILFWKSQREKIWIAWVSLFMMSCVFALVLERFKILLTVSRLILPYFAMILMIGMPVLLAIDGITWSVDKLLDIRLRRRLRKKN